MKLYWLQLKRPRYVLWLFGSLGIAGSLVLLCHFCGMMLCPLRRYTGIPCFTCGSTRALLALVSGEVKTAFLTQPLVVSLFCLVTPLALYSAFTVLLHRRIFLISLSSTEKIITGILLALALLLNWFYLLARRITL